MNGWRGDIDGAGISVPAQAILDQFKEAQQEITEAIVIAEYLSNHNNFGSHGRVVDIVRIKQAAALTPLKIIDLQTDKIFQEAVRDLYSAISFTFNAGVVKLFENSAGLRMAKAVQMRVVQGTPVP